MWVDILLTQIRPSLVRSLATPTHTLGWTGSTKPRVGQVLPTQVAVLSSMHPKAIDAISDSVQIQLLENISGILIWGGLFLIVLFLFYQANKILMEKIEDDQFLDLMTVKTDVRAVCKEPYRSSHRPPFDLFINLFSLLSDFQSHNICYVWYYFNYQFWGCYMIELLHALCFEWVV